MSVANSVTAALAVGLSTLVILEHVPEITGSIETPEEWYRGKGVRTPLDRISSDLTQLSFDHRNLTVIRGVEVDADPFLEDGSTMLEDFSGVDFVLGSTHILPGGSGFWFQRSHLSKVEKERMAGRWLEWAIRFVSTGRIDVLAHPGDLVGACMMLPPFDHAGVASFFDPLLDAMKEHQTAFELNELLGRKLIDPYRRGYPALVARAKERGLRFSLGSDAHTPEDVGQFDWVRRLIHDAGISKEDLITPGKKS